ncbi:hypothetical protein [Hymenobacter pini]|uniref:hypothetical protein n=1 Tax=Hymenobacter pini TaxID=2880879 RepID=UPI001CF36D5B|nr:hypothetical protein [Hymenobacter pini]MCA8830164.1 hypothetical protein [Hymenobacter pini]
MNLRALEQRVDLYHDEAEALHGALSMYHRLLVWRSGQRPLLLEETMSIRATLRVRERLEGLLRGPWPRTARLGRKPRRWRVEFDELLQLNALLVAGELFAPTVAQRPAFGALYLKLNQKALNLQAHFQL